MVNRIEWTQTALAELAQILKYLRDEVSNQAARRFVDILKKKIQMLETNKIEGRLVPKRKSLRFVTFGKNHRLYYRRHGLTLYLTRIYDTRQNPDNRPYN